MFPGWIWRDDGFASAFGQPVTQPPCIIGTVCEQAAPGGNTREKLGNSRQIMRLARRQAKRDRPSNLICQGMNLGRPSAA